MLPRGGSKATPLWTCPGCRRRFAKTNQAHSCRARSVGDHFRGKDPQLKAIFEFLIRELRTTGPLRVVAVESSINLISKHHFAGIAIRHDCLRVGFIADRKIRDRRIVRAERVGDHRVSHFMVVRSVDDLDAQVLGWLAEAQALQATAKNRPRPSA